MYSQPSLPYNGIIQTLFEKFLREVVGGGLVDVAAGAQFQKREAFLATSLFFVTSRRSDFLAFLVLGKGVSFAAFSH